MNLSPDWREILRAQGHEAIHWSETGDAKAPDREVMEYAARNGCIVFTHDLDFSAMLAATQARAPSIIQVRAQDTLSARFRDLVLDSLRRFEDQLAAGAIVVIEAFRARARVLPLRPGGD